MRRIHLKHRRNVRELETLMRMGGEEQTTDVLGSYTGTPRGGGEPDQDADDL